MAIYYVCPEDNRPYGGTKGLYRHVDVLNKNGLEAFVFHQRQGFRLTWFENDTKVVYPPIVFDKAKDWVVFPETYGLQISSAVPGVRKVIFNQNAHYTFLDYPVNSDKPPTPYLDSDVKGVLVVSEDSKRYLEYAFPDLSIFHVHPGLSAGFSCSGKKKKQIAFMPRKHIEEVRQVVNILKYRGALTGWELVPIQDVHESQVIQTLRESAIFLSFGYPEGCPGPPREAMACGCFLVGYHGQGGKEFMSGPTCWPIDEGKVLEFATAVEELIERFNDDKLYLAGEREGASKKILSSYSCEREEQEILELWNDIMTKTPEPSVADEAQPASVKPLGTGGLEDVAQPFGKFERTLEIDPGDASEKEQLQDNRVVCEYMFGVNPTERYIEESIRYAEESRQYMEESKQYIASLEEENIAKQSHIEEVKTYVRRVESVVQAQQDQIDETAEQVRRLQEDIVAKQAALEAADRQIEDLQNALSQRFSSRLMAFMRRQLGKRRNTHKGE